jgi:large subunit ribosomal protein L15
MPARFKKRVKKMRGSKTHGWGSKKKHRGGGSRGGKGKAGLMKHKKSWMIKYEPDHFGKIGFKVPVHAKKEIKAITLRDIDVLAKKSNLKEINVTEFGFQKVISSGKITQPLKIKAKYFVEKAKEKISKAGGEAIVIQ